MKAKIYKYTNENGSEFVGTVKQISRMSGDSESIIRNARRYDKQRMLIFLNRYEEADNERI